MAAVRGKDTRPELRLRRALHAAGLRYRVHYGRLVGRPDVAFPSSKVAVFVDGDFWHGRSWRTRGFRSLEEQFGRWRNSEWWLAKVRENILRDRRQTRALRRQGWTVLRLRDRDIERDLLACVVRVRDAVAGA